MSAPSYRSNFNAYVATTANVPCKVGDTPTAAQQLAFNNTQPGTWWFVATGEIYVKGPDTPYASGGRAVLMSSGGSSGSTFLAANGTAGAPSYSFLSDPTTGAYLAAAGNLGLSAGGSLVAQITSTFGIASVVNNGVNNDYSFVLSATHTTSGTPQAGIGASLQFFVESLASPSVAVGAGFVGAQLTDVTSGAEVSAVEMRPAFGGANNGAGIRVTGRTGTITKGINITPSAAASDPTIAPYGGANASINMLPLGTGGINMKDALNTITVLGVQNVTGAVYAPAMNTAINTTGGAQAINASAGSFRYLTTDGTGFIITNNHVLSANSQVILTFKRVDATLLRISALAAPGQFTVTGNAAPTANTDVSFIVINPSV